MACQMFIDECVIVYYNLMRASHSPPGGSGRLPPPVGQRGVLSGLQACGMLLLRASGFQPLSAHSAFISSTQSAKRGCAVNYRYNTASCLVYVREWRDYIMPPMPGAPMGISGLSSFLSQMTHSVVRNMPATEAAFSRATRVTLAGSSTPASRRSPKVSVLAL